MQHELVLWRVERVAEVDLLELQRHAVEVGNDRIGQRVEGLLGLDVGDVELELTHLQLLEVPKAWLAAAPARAACSIRRSDVSAAPPIAFACGRATWRGRVGAAERRSAVGGIEQLFIRVVAGEGHIAGRGCAVTPGAAHHVAPRRLGRIRPRAAAQRLRGGCSRQQELTKPNHLAHEALLNLNVELHHIELERAEGMAGMVELVPHDRQLQAVQLPLLARVNLVADDIAPHVFDRELEGVHGGLQHHRDAQPGQAHVGELLHTRPHERQPNAADLSLEAEAGQRGRRDLLDLGGYNQDPRRTACDDKERDRDAGPVDGALGVHLVEQHPSMHHRRAQPHVQYALVGDSRPDEGHRLASPEVGSLPRVVALLDHNSSGRRVLNFVLRRSRRTIRDAHDHRRAHLLNGDS
eukprot:scaffold9726_cov119-Isochrysis_galbana.AAC.26